MIFRLLNPRGKADADASSPGFAVTDSISIGRKGWYLETSAETSGHE